MMTEDQIRAAVDRMAARDAVRLRRHRLLLLLVAAVALAAWCVAVTLLVVG